MKPLLKDALVGFIFVMLIFAGLEACLYFQSYILFYTIVPLSRLLNAVLPFLGVITLGRLLVAGFEIAKTKVFKK